MAKDASDFLATDAAKRGAAQTYKDKDERRKRAIALRQGQAKAAAGAVGTLRQQAAENQKAIRYGASQATAMGMQPGMGAGGGAIAAAGQVGRDAEMAGIAKRAQDTDKILSAEQAAAQSAIEAEEYAAQQGDKDSDYQEAYAEGQTEAEQAIQDAQGFWDDDEAGAYRKIRAMIARIRVKSPQAADELEEYYLKGQGALRIESNWD
mgnify:CR=1 FL=1|tara:strand:+ start:6251 stop:6871 length:621 start_codon:yes stop_codon:yes gene_type:complete